MKRQMIKIDEEKCNGCALCVHACHEGAIELLNGKAVLMRDDYCDGLGNCLPVCPTGAITFETREALAYNEEEVKKNIQMKREESSDNNASILKKLPCGCPSTEAKTFDRVKAKGVMEMHSSISESELRQFPIQIQLVPSNASYFDNADVLIAADCTAFAYGNFHKDFMKGKITLIGCPKLDDADYSEKLTAILVENEIKSLTIVRMEVPCCGGIVESAKSALRNSGKLIPWSIITISRDGKIV